LAIDNMASAAQTNPDTPITFKVTIDGTARRLKLPLRDVGINVLESRVSSTTLA
jgi:next-to-BRCA1 protein 1